MEDRLDRNGEVIICLLTIRKPIVRFQIKYDPLHFLAMPNMLLRDLPPRSHLEMACSIYPELDPSATEAVLLLLRAGDDLTAKFQEYMHHFGVSSGGFSLMMLLVNKGTGEFLQCSPAELADRSGVSRATVTGVLDTLERAGLVMREPDLNDRRMVMVRLTPKGQDVIMRMLPVHFKYMADFMRDFSEEERSMLSQLCRKIIVMAKRPERTGAHVAGWQSVSFGAEKAGQTGKE